MNLIMEESNIFSRYLRSREINYIFFEKDTEKRMNSLTCVL